MDLTHQTAPAEASPAAPAPAVVSMGPVAPVPMSLPAGPASWVQRRLVEPPVDAESGPTYDVHLGGLRRSTDLSARRPTEAGRRSASPGLPGLHRLRRCSDAGRQTPEARSGTTGPASGPSLDRLTAYVDQGPTIRRALSVGGTHYGKETRLFHRSGLLTQIDHVVSGQDLKMTDRARRHVHKMIDLPGDAAPFSLERLVKTLVDEGLLDSKMAYVSTGPTTMGKRPGWAGDAVKMPSISGKDRRHVISASGLGKAIEDAADLTNLRGISAAERARRTRRICRFLDANGVGYPKTISLNAAAKAAWSIVCNHVGNLWMGPSDPNRVRGFIRGPFHAKAKACRDLDNARVQLSEVIADLDKPAGPGMNAPDATQLWKSMVNEVRLYLEPAKSRTGSVPAKKVVEALEEFERNADLDLPHDAANNYKNIGPDPAYLTKMITIYTTLKSPTMAIFDQGQELDQFMRLDAAGELGKANTRKTAATAAAAAAVAAAPAAAAAAGPPAPGKGKGKKRTFGLATADSAPSDPAPADPAPAAQPADGSPSKRARAASAATGRTVPQARGGGRGAAAASAAPRTRRGAAAAATSAAIESDDDAPMAGGSNEV